MLMGYGLVFLLITGVASISIGMHIYRRVKQSGREPLNITAHQWGSIVGNLVAAVCGLIYYLLIRHFGEP